MFITKVLWDSRADKMHCMKRENLPLLQSVVTASNPRRTMSHTQRRQVSVLVINIVTPAERRGL